MRAPANNAECGGDVAITMPGLSLRATSRPFAVAARPEPDHQRLDEHTQKLSVKIEARNHNHQAVDASVIEQMPGDWTITEKSHEFKKTDAHTVEFPITVPAKGSVTVTYTVRFRY